MADMEVLTEQIIQLIIVNLPNFIGLVLAVLVLTIVLLRVLRHNQELAARLDECSDRRAFDKRSVGD